MPKTIKEIKLYLDKINIEEISNALDEFREDKRAGVQNLIKAFERKKENYFNEIERVKRLNDFENNYYKNGLKYIAGVDEVGRGPLAGPVVTCAVILPPNTFIEGINDSKKISEVNRLRIYEEIKKIAIDYKIGIVDNKVIDDINILNATYKAMSFSVKGLEVRPDIVLVDAVRIPDIGILQHPIVSGDSKSISIAAASIMAKVTRDAMMVEYSKVYKDYDFENNKGYGTKNHIEGIIKHGVTDIHRKSFIKNIQNNNR